MSVVNSNPVLDNQYQTPEITRVDGPKELGKDAFLKLLMTQMQYQDPLNPVENTEFVAQLAQFSSVEQLTQVNEQFTSVNSALLAQNQFQSISLVGKQVKAAGSSLSVNNGDSIPGMYTLADAATKVTIKIYDADNKLVKVLEKGPQAQGEYNVDWDATDHLGTKVPDGVYKFEVIAKDNKDQSIETGSMIKGTVSGVTFGVNGVPTLLVGDIRMNIGDIIEISTPESGS